MKITDKNKNNTESILIAVFILLSIWCVGLTWGFLYLEDMLRVIESIRQEKETIQDTTIYHLKLIEVEYHGREKSNGAKN